MALVAESLRCTRDRKGRKRSFAPASALTPVTEGETLLVADGDEEAVAEGDEVVELDMLGLALLLAVADEEAVAELDMLGLALLVTVSEALGDSEAVTDTLAELLGVVEALVVALTVTEDEELCIARERERCRKARGVVESAALCYLYSVGSRQP